jgi:hypothetical protein
MACSTADDLQQQKKESQDWPRDRGGGGQCYGGGQVPTLQERSRSRGQFQGTLRPLGANGRKQALCQLTPAPSDGLLPVLVGVKESVALFAMGTAWQSREGDTAKTVPPRPVTTNRVKCYHD